MGRTEMLLLRQISFSRGEVILVFGPIFKPCRQSAVHEVRIYNYQQCEIVEVDERFMKLFFHFKTHTLQFKGQSIDFLP